MEDTNNFNNLNLNLSRQPSPQKLSTQHTNITYEPFDPDDKSFDPLKRRLQMPLSEIMQLLIEAKTYIPGIKHLPDKLGDLELEIKDLRNYLTQKYMTYQQLQAVNDLFRNEIEILMDVQKKAIMKKVTDMLADRPTFKYVDDLLKNKVSYDSVRSYEKVMMSLGSQFDNLKDKVASVEHDYRFQTDKLQGLTREDVENMIRYKADRIEFDKKLGELDSQCKQLNDKIQFEQASKGEFINKIEQSLNDLKLLVDKNRETQQKYSSLVDQINDLQNQQKNQTESMIQINKQIEQLGESLNKQEKIIKDHQQHFDKDNTNERLNRLDTKIDKQREEILRKISKLGGEFNQKYEKLDLTSLLQQIDQLKQRLIKNEVALTEIGQDNVRLRSYKQKKVDDIEQAVRNIENHINSKIWIKINTQEQQFKDNLQNQNDQFQQIENKINYVQGPLRDEFIQIKNQNETIMRELEKTQTNYRELMSDYMKTLDAKLEQMLVKPNTFINNLKSTDDLIRSATRARLSQASKDNALLLQKSSFVMNTLPAQDIMSNKSLLSQSDVSLMKQMKRPETTKTVRTIVHQQIVVEDQTEYKEQERYSSPLSIQGQHQQLNQTVNNYSPSGISIKSVLQQQNNIDKNKKRAVKSAIGHRRNLIRSQYMSPACMNQYTTNTTDESGFAIKIINSQPLQNQIQNKEQSQLLIASEQSNNILGEFVNSKNIKQIEIKRPNQRKRQARTTINSSMEQSRANSGEQSTVDVVTGHESSGVMARLRNNYTSVTQQNTKGRVLEKEMPVTLHRFKHLMTPQNN